MVVPVEIDALSARVLADHAVDLAAALVIPAPIGPTGDHAVVGPTAIRLAIGPSRERRGVAVHPVELIDAEAVLEPNPGIGAAYERDLALDPRGLAGGVEDGQV